MGDSLVWVDVPCPLCDARRDEPILMAPTAHGICRLARCGACGLVYLNPRPSEDTLGLLYPPEGAAGQGAAAGRDRRRGLLHSLRRLALVRYEGYPGGRQTGLQRALAPLGRLMLDWQRDSMSRLPWVGEGRLLVTGGSPWFAERMRGLGWKVTARDVGHWLSGAADDPLCFNVPPASFDVVTLGSLLEHVPSPHRVIAAAAAALAPGGLLVVSVPCINSWSFRTFGADWSGLELPRRLLHFSPQTLRKLVEMHGLQVREIRPVARTGWLRRTLKTARVRPGTGLLRRLFCHTASWSPIARLIGRWGAETRQADSIKLIAVRPAAATLRRAA